MLNFIEYLADNTPLIKIWNKLPFSIKKIIYSFLQNIFLFPSVFYKIYYTVISTIYPRKDYHNIQLENLRNSKSIKRINYELVIDAILKSNLFAFDIRKDYENICVLINNKNDLLNFFSILKENALIYVFFESKIGRTIPTKLFFIPSYALNSLISISDSFFIYQRYSSTTNRILFSEHNACKLDIWFDDVEFHEHTKDKPRVKVGSRKWITANDYLIKEKVQNYYNVKKHSDFPIDIVYTWVNDNDPQWQSSLDKTINESNVKNTLLKSSASQSRFTNRDELKYSLRSICMYADFFNKVFIVTAGQTPEWLNTDNSRIQLIDHKEIFPEPENECLPTFNSQAIESRLHHIEDLNEHFIYFNDDFFIGRTVSPRLFFANKNISYIFPIDSRFIELNDADDIDLPAAASAKNDRNLILHEFNDIVTECFMHVPYALRKSILLEIENKFRDTFIQTAKNKFRNTNDISSASSLFQHYSHSKGLSMHGSISHHYIDLNSSNLKHKLDSLLSLSESERPDTFCINELDINNKDLEQMDILVRNTLENYFPLKSEFEK